MQTMQEKLSGNLIALADAFQAARPLTDGSLSAYAAKDSRFIEKVRSGSGSFTVAQYDRVVAWFSANAPRGMRWPRGIPRPRRANRDAEVAAAG